MQEPSPQQVAHTILCKVALKNNQTVKELVYSTYYTNHRTHCAYHTVWFRPLLCHDLLRELETSQDMAKSKVSSNIASLGAKLKSKSTVLRNIVMELVLRISFLVQWIGMFKLSLIKR